MVNNCANPKCAKPLHYLRDGRIFVFDVQDRGTVGADGKIGHHLEHFWLCGQCSPLFQVEYEYASGVRLMPRRPSRMRVLPDTFDEKEPAVSTALAS
jgi:hypothetical protein